MNETESQEFMNPNYVEENQEMETPIQEQKLEERENETDAELSEPVEENSNKNEVPKNNQPEESIDEKNWKALRKLKQQAEEERDAALRAYREMQMQAGNRQSQAPVEEDDYSDLGISAEDLVEGKHLSKVSKELKKIKSALELYQTEHKLKKKYSDFDDVVTKENLELLVAREPELAKGLDANPDLYSKAVTAYNIIKNLQIYNPTKRQQLNNLAKVSDKIDENLSRPQVAASVSPQTGSTPLSRANEYAEDYSREELDRVYREMLERANGR